MRVVQILGLVPGSEDGSRPLSGHSAATLFRCFALCNPPLRSEKPVVLDVPTRGVDTQRPITEARCPSKSDEGTLEDSRRERVPAQFKPTARLSRLRAMARTTTGSVYCGLRQSSFSEMVSTSAVICAGDYSHIVTEPSIQRSELAM
jgi:hypothetical protein